MSGDFFDTNVLLYLISEDAEKADRAEALARAASLRALMCGLLDREQIDLDAV